MGKRTLVKNVEIDTVWYGPDHGNADLVPDEVAARITNPTAWDDYVAGDPTPPPTPEPSSTAGTPPEPEPAPPVDNLDELDKDGLLQVAETEGIKVNKRAGAEKLAATIRAARAASQA